MAGKADKRARQWHSLVNLIGALLLIVAAALILLLLFQSAPKLQVWYQVYQLRLSALEGHVLALRNISVWLLIGAVLVLYAFKSVLSIYPISFLCVLTAAIRLPLLLSLALNVLGLVVLVSLRYLWGRRRGGGNVQKLLSLHRDLRAFLRHGGKAKPWLLFIFRVTPSFPVNSVSQIYGAMGFDYVDFTLISLLGFLPKLISYILIGNNWNNPLSNAFLIPLVIVFTLSGLSVIGINVSLTRQRDESEHDQNQNK
ncbi:MAG: VTT domain-containing protein [Oscillospiraceae bacterium]|jgi:uncharacterized membrane protein YdjX (TVP38/TMEM64 family)|nr:VTT domain-containing protein [Oscillospiraceae bacterium]